MASEPKLTSDEAHFLGRFVSRGWLSMDRDDPFEREAVRKALRKRYLRRELSEGHFTPAGRIALDGAREGETR